MRKSKNSKKKQTINLQENAPIKIRTAHLSLCIYKGMGGRRFHDGLGISLEDDHSLGH